MYRYRLILALPNHPYLQEESAEESENARWDVGAGPDWLADLGEGQAVQRGLGGPVIAGTDGSGQSTEARVARAGTPRPWEVEWGPGVPPPPSEYADMYT
jgi:hypothetical protein